MTDEQDAYPPIQSPCCRDYSAEHGLGVEGLCPPCSDYRHFRHDILDKTPRYEIPPGFEHRMYSSFEVSRNGIEQPKKRPPVSTPPRRRRGYRP